MPNVVDWRDAATVIAEAERRTKRRAAGQPLHEDSVSALAREPEAGRYWHYAGPQQQPPSGLKESIEQERIVAMFKLAGGIVYRLSQPRATKQTPGLSDLLVFWVGAPYCALFWESKIEGGEISDAQQAFKLNCSQSMARYGNGDVRAAGDWLVRVGLAEYDETERIGVRFVRNPLGLIA